MLVKTNIVLLLLLLFKSLKLLFVLKGTFLFEFSFMFCAKNIKNTRTLINLRSLYEFQCVARRGERLRAIRVELSLFVRGEIISNVGVLLLLAE